MNPFAGSCFNDRSVGKRCRKRRKRVPSSCSKGKRAGSYMFNASGSKYFSPRKDKPRTLTKGGHKERKGDEERSIQRKKRIPQKSRAMIGK